jgi:hypothetical protein
VTKLHQLIQKKKKEEGAIINLIYEANTAPITKPDKEITKENLKTNIA